MRIVFVTNNYTPYSGGVVSSIFATVNELQKKGHDVSIITLDFIGTPLDDPEYVIRIPCFTRFRYKKNYMAIPWRSTSAVTDIIKKIAPDIVHVHHPFLLGKSGLKAARALSLPCVFTYHTMYDRLTHYVPFPACIVRPIIRFMVRRFCESVDGIIVPSCAIKNYLVEQKIDCSIAVIPSPLRLSFLSQPRVNKDQIAPRIFKLLVVTRFVKEKNVPFVFSVLQQLPSHFRLTLVGYGEEYEKLQTMAYEQYEFSRDRVIFVHKPAMEDLLTLYQEADLFIFPSQTDTQGLVVIEALSQGLPVIALDGPGQRDTICDGYNGFIVEHAGQMVQIIIKIFQDERLHGNLRTGARKTALNYAPDRIIDRLVEFYSSLRSK